MTRTEIRNKNHVVAVDPVGEVVAEARRSAPGNLWRIWFYGTSGKYPLRGPDARVSGRMPEVQQRKLVMALLNAA